MRDKRSIITEKVCMALIKHGIEQNIIDDVRTLLEVELLKCDVYDRCTTLTVVYRTPYQILQEFLNVK